MKISVTQEHIDKGHRRRLCECPVALALIDAGFNDASVYNPYFLSGGKSYSLPLEAKFRISAYDQEKKMYPFEFDLNVNI